MLELPWQTAEKGMKRPREVSMLRNVYHASPEDECEMMPLQRLHEGHQECTDEKSIVKCIGGSPAGQGSWQRHSWNSHH